MAELTSGNMCLRPVNHADDHRLLISLLQIISEQGLFGDDPVTETSPPRVQGVLTNIKVHLSDDEKQVK